MNKHNKIIDSCGFSPEMREYLKSQNLSEFTLTQIVAGAPIALNKKLELYSLLENEDAKTLYHETEQAILELTLKSGEIFSFEECWYDYEIIEEKKAFSSLFTSPSAALDYLREEIKEEEWDETSECWTELKKWVPNKDGTMDYTYTYYLIRDEIVYFESKKYPPHHQNQGYVSSMDLDLPIPFKVGDIVTLNSLPFAPIRQAVLIEVDNRDCCGVQLLYKHDDGYWHTGALKHGAGWHRNRPLLSSLYRLQKTQPVASEEGELLKRISAYISDNTNYGKEIWEIMNHFEKWKESGRSEELIKSPTDSRNITDKELTIIINSLNEREKEMGTNIGMFATKYFDQKPTIEQIKEKLTAHKLFIEKEKGTIGVFSKVTFGEIDLRELDFSGIVFKEVVFEKTIFIGAKFNNAVFIDCVFHDVDMRETDLSASKIFYSFIMNSNLKGSTLEGADIYATNFWNTNFQSTNASASTFIFASLNDGNFENANLKESILTFTDIDYTCFAGADCTKARFVYNSNTEYANFKEADLTDTFFTDNEEAEGNQENEDEQE